MTAGLETPFFWPRAEDVPHEYLAAVRGVFGYWTWAEFNTDGVPPVGTFFRAPIMITYDPFPFRRPATSYITFDVLSRATFDSLVD